MTPPTARIATLRVPTSTVLAAWSAHDWRGGVHVDDLVALDGVLVKTHNSTYEIIVVSAESAEILVRGGAFFPDFTPARLAGSSLGGAFLKLRSVHVGFRLEIATERGFVLTSPVRSIERAGEPADASIM